MSLWDWLTRRRPDHGWPGYIINGRIRTSTASLILAFLVLSWLYNAYQPPQSAPSTPETQVVPPGFVPNPEYTWVPRTYVQTTPTTTTSPTATPTTTTETNPTETTTGPPGQAPTTVIDPDGSGTLPAQTITGTPTVSPTTVIPGPSATPTTLPSSPGPSSLPAGQPR